MRGNGKASRLGIALVGAVLLQAGCGGSSEPDQGGLFGQAEVDDDASDSDTSDGGAGDQPSFGDPIPGALPAGPVTVATEPGHAVVTVADGSTTDHTPVGPGTTFRCVFADDQINLDVRSEHGGMLLTALRGDDGWTGRFTADADEGAADDWIQYSAQPFNGELGIDHDTKTLSYVGSAVRQDRNAMSDGDIDTPTVAVTVAVNCGIEPAVIEVADQTFTFAPFEADSMTCQITGPDSIDVTLNSLGSQDRQLQFDLRPDGDGVIGGVYVTDGDDNWRAIISTSGDTAGGLSVDGATATFTGTFEHTSDVDPDLAEEFEGTATVTCPT
ncbi:MAG: hypothetical protein R8G01_13385 [Ilumatobacteraceae bacterium]|nr:hypothetical protein [Ilumatobacteraceae bacterium]